MRALLLATSLFLSGALAAQAVPLQLAPVSEPGASLGRELGEILREELAPRLAAMEGSEPARLILTFQGDPRASFVRLSDREGRYLASTVLQLDLKVPGSPAWVMMLPWHGESSANALEAEQRARDALLEDYLPRLRLRFPLHAMLLQRQGRHAELEPGRTAGLREGTFFGATGSVAPEGRLRITTVSPERADAEILEGLDRFAPGTPLIELPAGGLPASAGAVGLSGQGGSFAGLALSYRRTGYGWDAGLEFGNLWNGATRGIGMQAHAGYQFELWPERLWLDAQAGVAGSLLTQDLAGTPYQAGASALHGLMGLELASRLGPCLMGLGFRFLTPWQATAWQQTSGTAEPQDVSAQVDHPLMGGWQVLAEIGVNL